MDDLYENIYEKQMDLINTRKKFKKAVVKLEEQINKIEVKLLKNTKIEISPELNNGMEDYKLDEDLLKKFDCYERNTNEKFNDYLKKLENVEKLIRVNNRIIQSDLYKQILD